MKSDDTFTLEDIQDEIILEEAQPSHEALRRWCERFPEHEESLAKFFATWAVQIEKTTLPELDEALVGSRMVSHAMDLVHKLRSSLAHSETKASELRLYKMIRASDVSEDDVMSQCDLDESLLAKLNRRLIAFASIPSVCVERLAKAIRCEVTAIVSALSGEPIPLGSYKAKTKPSLKQESFSDAVASSDLSEATKAEWLALISTDKSK